uniref:Uncharacterized protein n=1 Tax=Callorhinchus milii TaxID=7868 RepID=A0A4W3GFL4_CALMI
MIGNKVPDEFTDGIGACPSLTPAVAFPSQWCRRGQCLVYGDEGPKPIDGQWSPWSEWSECSRTCGGGVTYKERHCDSPNRVYRVCNAQACQRHAVSFRAQQCAEYNSRPFRGWYYKWKPYLKVDGKTPSACGKGERERERNGEESVERLDVVLSGSRVFSQPFYRASVCQSLHVYMKVLILNHRITQRELFSLTQRWSNPGI